MYKDNVFNPDGYKVVVFLEKDKAEIKEGTTFNGSIYSLDKEIKAKGKSNSPTYMNGFFIGEKVKGEKNVTWNWSTDCGFNCPIIPTSKSEPLVSSGGDDEEMIFNVIAYPNPFYSGFNLEIESDFGAPVTIAIYDMNGRMVEVYQDIDPLGLPEMGQYLSNGMYMVTVNQAGHTEVIKVNKLN